MSIESKLKHTLLANPTPKCTLSLSEEGKVSPVT